MEGMYQKEICKKKLKFTTSWLHWRQTKLNFAVNSLKDLNLSKAFTDIAEVSIPHGLRKKKTSKELI